MVTPTVFDFRIRTLMPQTLPMARLAEYLARLAVLFGHQDQVYFSKVRKGSVVPEIHVHEIAVPKVQARLQLVGAGSGPEDAVKAVQAINALLRDDDTSATLGVKGGGLVIDFPGFKTPLAQEAVVHEAGELIGSVIRVGGRDETIPLLLRDTDGTTHHCNTSKAIACELAHHLFGDLVRVQGHGKWRRNSERVWVLDEFKVKGWELVDQTSLEDTVAVLRAVQGSQWNTFSDPQAELKKLREA